MSRAERIIIKTSHSIPSQILRFLAKANKFLLLYLVWLLVMIVLIACVPFY